MPVLLSHLASVMLCVSVALCGAHRTSDIPLYRKDLPYCTRSLLFSDNVVKERDVWSKTPGSDYKVEFVPPNKVFCPVGRHVTALQIDLGGMRRIAGIVVTGQERKKDEPLDKEDDDTLPRWSAEMWARFATHYTIEYSPDHRIWSMIKDEKGKSRYFKTTQLYRSTAFRVDNEPLVVRGHLQTFDPNIHARFIRLNVKGYIKTSCVPAIDVIGCDSDLALNNIQRIDKPVGEIKRGQCSHHQPLGMETGEIKDNQIHASSTQHYHLPTGARWKWSTRKSFWCANVAYDKNPYIMVDLFPRTKYLTNVIYEKHVFGFNLNVYFSVDGKKWENIKKYIYPFYWWTRYGEHSEKIMYPPQEFRFVKFYFRRNTQVGPYHACVMFELFGCSAETQTRTYYPGGIAKRRTLMEHSPGIPGRNDYRDMSMTVDPYDSFCFKGPYRFTDFGNPRRRYDFSYHYMQFDLIKLYAVTHVVTKGHFSNHKKCGEFIKSWVLWYGMTGKEWLMVRNYNGANDWRLRVKFLNGSQITCQTGILRPVPIAVGRFFRFIPDEYYITPCLKFELIGFEPGVQPLPLKTQKKSTPACSKPLGMKSGAIKSGMMRASSWQGGCEPNKGRLDFKGAWCVEKCVFVKKYLTNNHSLDIDLGRELVIDGFASQGHPEERTKRWVLAYVVHYSPDGVAWDIISSYEHEMVFEANKDCCTIKRHDLNPRIRARYIRFVPLAWHNWPCMRVEVYGCSDGTTSESRLFEKMRDIETRRLSMVHLGHNSKLSYNCGDYNTWGHTNYLKINLDTKKSVWYQVAFGKEFPLLGKTLILSRKQFPNDFGHRHFMCVGRTRDGMDIFRQHLLVVPDGPRNPWWLAPHSGMQANPSAEIPQIVVIQRFDPTYDGGFPVFSQPAVVQASGNIGSLAVFVLGIPYYPSIMHNCLVTSHLTDFRLTHLGTVPDNDLNACARLALSRGYEYMILLKRTECMSSWYLPLATSPHRTRDRGQCRLEPKVYFISATFEEYRISWYRKIDDKYLPWKRLFSYAIKPKSKLTSLIYSVDTEPDPTVFKHFKNLPYRARDRYRTYDKALYGDTYTGSHVMDVLDWTLEDIGAYKFEVEVPSRGVKNEAVIELRHEKEPRIDLPDKFIGCRAVPASITVTMFDNDVVDPEQWLVHWNDAFFHGHELRRWSYKQFYYYKPSGKCKETLTWTDPITYKGHYFEAQVKNRYGMTSAMAEIDIASKEDTPYPEWVTPSPFQAIEGLSQILEVRLKTDRAMESVSWFHNDKPIEVANERYAFPESTGAIRTKLKLARIDEKTPGQYKAVIKSKFCHFEKFFDVKVIVIPRITYLPRADYVIAKPKDKQVIFNVTVRGGDPKPKLQDMTWHKGKSKLIPTHSGRVVQFTTLDDKNNWFTVLKIRDVRVSDTGQYTFEVVSGPTSTKQSWRLSVDSKHTKSTVGPAVPRPSVSTSTKQQESRAVTFNTNSNLRIVVLLCVCLILFQNLQF